MAVTDDDLPPSQIDLDDEGGVFDLDGEDDEETPPPPPPTKTTPPPAPRARRRSGRRADRVASASPPAPSSPPPPVAVETHADVIPISAAVAAVETTDDRDVRAWWPKLLQGMINEGYTPADIRLTIFRTRAANRPAESPKGLSPSISGEQVQGHENLSPGEALVDAIVDIFHQEARGPATYKVRAYNLRTSSSFGKHGTLDLDGYDEIINRRRRLGEGRAFAGSPAPYAPPPYAARGYPAPYASAPQIRYAPPSATAASAPAAPSPPPAPVATPAGNDANAFMLSFAQRMMEDALAAQREGRQAVMPQLPPAAPVAPPPAAPAPPVVSEDERMAKVVTATITALVNAGILPKPGAPATAAATAPAAEVPNMFDQLYAFAAQQEKMSKTIGMLAKQHGFVRQEDVEVVQAPVEVVGPETPRPAEGQGRIDFLFERITEEISKDPMGALSKVGKILDGPFGSVIKDILAKQGVRLPSIPTTGFSTNDNSSSGGWPTP